MLSKQLSRQSSWEPKGHTCSATLHSIPCRLLQAGLGVKPSLKVEREPVLWCNLLLERKRCCTAAGLQDHLAGTRTVASEHAQLGITCMSAA